MPRIIEHDGNYRPAVCAKYCVYNYNARQTCHYKKDETLSQPIQSWQKCPYFVHADSVKEKSRKRQEFDGMYGHMAKYKDSHSAVWMD